MASLPTHRAVYREDINLLKEKIRSKEVEVGEDGKKKAGQGEESTSFKNEVPPNSLTLQFVHG